MWRKKQQQKGCIGTWNVRPNCNRRFFIFNFQCRCRSSLDCRGSDWTANRKWIGLRGWKQWIIKISAEEEEKSVGGKRGLIYRRTEAAHERNSLNLQRRRRLNPWMGMSASERERASSGSTRALHEWPHFKKETRGRHFKLVMGEKDHKDIAAAQ